MAYNRTLLLGDDFDDFYSSPTSLMSPQSWEVPTAYDGGVVPSKEVPWYQTLVNVAAPLTQAAGNIIRAVQGQPQTTVYDPTKGRFVPIALQSQQAAGSWLLPALIIGGGAFLLMKKR